MEEEGGRGGRERAIHRSMPPLWCQADWKFLQYSSREEPEGHREWVDKKHGATHRRQSGVLSSTGGLTQSEKARVIRLRKFREIFSISRPMNSRKCKNTKWKEERAFTAGPPGKRLSSVQCQILNCTANCCKIRTCATLSALNILENTTQDKNYAEVYSLLKHTHR